MTDWVTTEAFRSVYIPATQQGDTGTGAQSIFDRLTQQGYRVGVTINGQSAGLSSVLTDGITIVGRKLTIAAFDYTPSIGTTNTTDVIVVQLYDASDNLLAEASTANGVAVRGENATAGVVTTIGPLVMFVAGDDPAGGVVGDNPYTASTKKSGTVARTLQLPSDDPVTLRHDFIGWHIWNTFDSKVPYNDKGHLRQHDARRASNTDDGGLLWANWHTGRHEYDRPRLTEFKSQAKTYGGRMSIAMFMTPPAFVSETHKQAIRARFGPENQDNQIHGGASRYPSFPYSARPPTDYDVVEEGVKFLFRPTTENGPGGEPGMGFTSDDIGSIGIWNEVEFGHINGNTRFTDAGGLYPFCDFTASELAKFTAKVFDAVPAGVMVVSGGWEGDSTPERSHMHAWAVADVGDGTGRKGIQCVHALGIHPYMYGYDPERMQAEIDGYRAQLIAIALEIGDPSIATLPIWADEVGMENPDGEDGQIGTGSYIIDHSGQIGYDIIARCMKRAAFSALANARPDAGGVVSCTFYQDRPNSGANAVSNARQTFGAPHHNATLTAAANDVDRINSGDPAVPYQLRQAYLYADNSIWVELSTPGGTNIVLTA